MSGTDAVRGLGLAAQLLEVGRPDEALATLAQVSSAGRESPDYWAVVASANLAAGRLDAAQDAAATGLRIEPNDVRLLAQQGAVSLALGDLPRAERALLGALALKADDPGLLSMYAMAVAADGQVAKAEALMEEAARLAPTDADVLALRAQLAYISGNDGVARQRALAALREDPTTGNARRTLAALSLAQARPRAAASHLAAIARADPRDHESAAIARAVTAEGHWLLAGMWPVRRFGSEVVWLACLAVLATLYVAAPRPVLFAWVVAYLLFCIYTWFAPPLVRWWFMRR